MISLGMVFVFFSSALAADNLAPGYESGHGAWYPGTFYFSPQAYLDAVRAQRQAMVDNDTQISEPPLQHWDPPRNSIDHKRRSYEERAEQRRQRMERLRLERLRRNMGSSGPYFQGGFNQRYYPGQQPEPPPPPQ